MYLVLCRNMLKSVHTVPDGIRGESPQRWFATKMLINLSLGLSPLNPEGRKVWWIDCSFLPVPDEFMYNPVTRSYGEPHKRPEILNSTVEFIASSDYMVSHLKVCRAQEELAAPQRTHSTSIEPASQSVIKDSTHCITSINTYLFLISPKFVSSIEKLYLLSFVVMKWKRI